MSIDVRYEDDIHCILLPTPPRSDPYAFLKEQLSVETRTNLLPKDIEVRQIGSDFPANLPWPSDRPLTPGTYRVVIDPSHSAEVVGTGVWQLTCRIDTVNYGGYWTSASAPPDTLHLQLSSTSLSEAHISALQRLPGYDADSDLLEWPYYREFPEHAWHFQFAADQSLDKHALQAQQQYTQALEQRKLMIRVKIFSDDQELILRPHHSGIFLGYLRPTGFIETTANAQFRRFVESKQLVLILDLDGTLVSAEPDNQEAFRTCQHAVELHLRGPDKPWFCVPRARLVEFFLKLIWKYHIMFCTAGMPDYAETVINKLRETLLVSSNLTERDRKRVSEAVDGRRIISTRYTQNREFKTLGMVLAAGFLPELAQKLCIILDDRTDVWTRESDKKLVWQIQAQATFTSYSSPAPSLDRYAALFSAIHDYVFRYDQQHRVPLPDVMKVGMERWVARGGTNFFASLVNT